MLTSGDALTGAAVAAAVAAASKPPEVTPLPMPSSDDPLLNLSLLNQKLNSLRHFLSSSIIAGDPSSLPSDAQIQLVSSELSSAVHQIILNGAALLSSSTASVDPTPPPAASKPSDPPEATPAIDPIRPQVSRKAPDPINPEGTTSGVPPDDSVVEIDAAELVAEHVHFCEVCGKGFKRDANLRMHMRAHGDQFKTLSALRSSPAAPSPPPVAAGGDLRFSCPVSGCTRNRAHKKFRPLKSAVCVKNHFKRSHCPKTFACERCDKSFSVMADLRSHLKVCGESCRWRCSCGTRFSRKDKLFAHVGLFEGHAPVVVEEGGEEGVGPEFFEGLMEEIGGVFGR